MKGLSSADILQTREGVLQMRMSKFLKYKTLKSAVVLLFLSCKQIFT